MNCGGCGTQCGAGQTCTGGKCNNCPTGEIVCNGACVTCATPGPCQVTGTCNATTGTCPAVNAADGTACDDSNACTQTDTCQSGACMGGNPVACTASDQCHAAERATRRTGVCSNPAAANGTACNDGNACTQTDTCQSGTCTGSNPVTCTASDQCHVAGTCNPSTGTCSNPTACERNRVQRRQCLYADRTCQSGTCTGAIPSRAPRATSAMCGHVQSEHGHVLEPDRTRTVPRATTAMCVRRPIPARTGVCTGTNPVTCTASDPCHVAGTCNMSTGMCSRPQR